MCFSLLLIQAILCAFFYCWDQSSWKCVFVTACPSSILYILPLMGTKVPLNVFELPANPSIDLGKLEINNSLYFQDSPSVAVSTPTSFRSSFLDRAKNEAGVATSPIFIRPSPLPSSAKKPPRPLFSLEEENSSDFVKISPARYFTLWSFNKNFTMEMFEWVIV